jgi:hypothetical protein
MLRFVLYFGATYLTFYLCVTNIVLAEPDPVSTTYLCKSYPNTLVTGHIAYSQTYKQSSNKQNYCHIVCMTIDGVWLMNRFIDHLQVIITNKYNTITVSTLQFTGVHSLVFSVC